MTVISGDLVLAEGADFTPDHPIIGWRNIVTPNNIVSSATPAAGCPASNLANPATFLKWKSTTTADQTLTLTTGTADTIDYLAIAKHNLGSAHCSIQITDGANDLLPVAMLPNDGPAIFRFNNPATLASIVFNILAPTVAPEIGVMYVGKLLVLERRIYAGHVPMPHGRAWKATNGMSESGQFLGRIVLQEFVRTKIPLSLLSPTWFRENLDPFLAVAQETPFFFAWRPQTYPLETGYGWLTSEPAPAPAAPSNLIALSLEISGVR